MDKGRLPDFSGERVRRISRRRLLTTIGLVGLSGGIASLTSRTPAAASPAPQPTAAPAAAAKPANQGGTLVYAGDGIGENFLPSVSFQGWTHHMVKVNCFETLYRSPDFKSIAPGLALSHTVSPDGLTWTFQLRKGVKFHDGTPFNAEAVEFNYMRHIDKAHPYYDANLIGGGIFLANVKSVKAKEEFVVEFVRDRPSAAFPALMVYPDGGVVSPTAIKKAGVKDIGRNPVGTGPFVFEKGEKGNQASMTAFDGYWGGRPPLDRIVLRQITDDQAMQASLLSGEVDVTSFVDFKDLDSYRKNANLSVQVVPAVSTGYMGINQKHPTLKDARLRRALCHAVNKQKIIDLIFYGEADMGAGLCPIPSWAYAPQLKDYYKYDPQKAKGLVKEAGGAPELVVNVQSAGFWPRMAELVQADFNAVGFKTTIEKIDTATFLGRMTEGNHQLFLMDGTYSMPDPEELFWTFYGCGNPRSKRWGYCDPKIEDLRAKQTAEMDREKRKQVLWDMQKLLLDETAPAVNYYNRFATVMNKRVKGLSPLPIRALFFEKTYVT